MFEHRTRIFFYHVQSLILTSNYRNNPSDQNCVCFPSFCFSLTSHRHAVWPSGSALWVFGLDRYRLKVTSGFCLYHRWCYGATCRGIHSACTDLGYNVSVCFKPASLTGITQSACLTRRAAQCVVEMWEMCAAHKTYSYP